jgi:Transcriptional Coactivator p15 (PC4)
MSESMDRRVIAVLPKNSREEYRISLGDYRDMRLVDVRTYVDIEGNGERVATRKGISIRMDRLGELSQPSRTPAPKQPSSTLPPLLT